MDPSLATALTLGLLALFIGALVVGSQLRRRSKHEFRRAWADAATARGWSFTERDDRLTQAFSSKPFRRGASRHPQALDVIAGAIHGRPAVAFRYRYTRGTNPDNLADIYSWFTVCAVGLPGELAAIPQQRRSFTIDRSDKAVRQVARARGTTWCLDGNSLVCWQRGESVSFDVVLARLEVLAAVVDGQAGRITAR
jgi:hypothetical protein